MENLKCKSIQIQIKSRNERQVNTHTSNCHCDVVPVFAFSWFVLDFPVWVCTSFPCYWHVYSLHITLLVSYQFRSLVIPIRLSLSLSISYFCFQVCSCCNHIYNNLVQLLGLQQIHCNPARSNTQSTVDTGQGHTHMPLGSNSSQSY